MRVPVELANAFGAEFETVLSRFAHERGLLPEVEALHSPRFLARSVIPHIQKLSGLFNRLESRDPRDLRDSDQRAAKADQQAGLDPYWKESSNPANMRLAYFLYFMPSNLFRVASVWAELSRLGFKWPAQSAQLRAIEFGAGPAAGAAGIAAGERFAPTGMPKTGDWALIEQEKAMLELGAEWAETYFQHHEFNDWGIRRFHRAIDLKRGLLPPTAPRFNLWVMSYFLNEFSQSPQELAQKLVESWERHLEQEGIVILIEPALKLQSRKLLEIRKELLALREKNESLSWLQILLPCLGHQACGALADAEDWCHEEVTWWRPPFFRKVDQMAGLDRKTLPFSYLVIARSARAREEILPALAQGMQGKGDRYRLVSPAHREGKELEFFTCGEAGKRRARYRPQGENDEAAELGRGDILSGATVRGDVHASRIERIRKKI